MKRERTDLGDTTHLGFTYPLACRRGGPCLPREQGRTYELPEVRVSYIVTEIGDRQTTRVPLATLSGGSRLLGGEPLRAGLPRRCARRAAADVPGLADAPGGRGARPRGAARARRPRLARPARADRLRTAMARGAAAHGGEPTSSERSRHVPRHRTCRGERRGQAGARAPRRASSTAQRATTSPYRRAGSPGRSRRPSTVSSAGWKRTSRTSSRRGAGMAVNPRAIPLSDLRELRLPLLRTALIRIGLAARAPRAPGRRLLDRPGRRRRRRLRPDPRQPGRCDRPRPLGQHRLDPAPADGERASATSSRRASRSGSCSSPTRPTRSVPPGTAHTEMKPFMRYFGERPAVPVPSPRLEALSRRDVPGARRTRPYAEYNRLVEAASRGGSARRTRGRARSARARGSHAASRRPA